MLLFYLCRLKEEIREAKGLHRKPPSKNKLSIHSFDLGCKCFQVEMPPPLHIIFFQFIYSQFKKGCPLQTPNLKLERAKLMGAQVSILVVEHCSYSWMNCSRKEIFTVSLRNGTHIWFLIWLNDAPVILVW